MLDNENFDCAFLDSKNNPPVAHSELPVSFDSIKIFVILPQLGGIYR